MSRPQSRPSIDLGASQLPIPILAIEDNERKSVPRSTPSRLQHSPSLPNIWFPPHSGPIPPEMSKVEGSRIQRPSAPPSPRPSPPKVSSEKELRPQNRPVKYASIDPVTTKSSISKTHARRRTERDQPHSLLTPPLTPSSSIQTSTSRDSSTSAQPSSDTDDTPISEEIVDPDSESTRILLLENVNRQLSVEDLKSAIIESLVAFSSEKNAMDDHTKTPIFQLLHHDPLKGVNGRHLVSKGVIPVVFFDVRVAKVAKGVLADRNVARFRGCVGDEIDDKGECRGLSARLVTLEELSKTLGYSTFLDGVNGSFSMSIQLLRQTVDDADDKSASSVVEVSDNNLDIKIDAEHRTISRGRFKVNILQNIVKSFGAVRLFNFARQVVDQEGNCSLVYNVEYHDSREAAIAFDDLSDKRMFGMKITVSRKTGNPQRSGGFHATVPFPNTSTAGESFVGLTANHTAIPPSQPRPQFTHPRKDHEGGTKIHDDQEYISPQPSPHAVPTGDASSPPFFYTSTPPSVELSNNSSALCGEAPGSTLNSTHHAHLQEQVWDGDHIHSPGAPGYMPDGICLYCPSRGPVQYNAGFTHYAMSASTPGAIYYPAPANTTQLANVLNVAPIHDQGAFVYDYMDAHPLQPIPNAGPWGFDPAIAAIGPGPNNLIPLVATNIPSAPPFFLRDESIPQVSGQLYQAGYIQTPDQNFAQPQLRAYSSSRHSAILPKALAHIPTRESSPSTYHSTSFVKYETSTAASEPPSSGQNERNQLNIARIEEGLDTRSTVMIKNIPNKMSDTDLTEYIGRVCPRRIDFLYLRMDFKNGCNVGYAFVNFITVQDLLHFAKERLGAKWNMFSSEKVLQMSYANYQGKEALVEKFKNSAIMDERESWRPRIFHSSGPQQGLLEPFPAPTHIRRKERSSYNRETLYPPNNGSNSMLHNNSVNRRYNEHHRLRHHRPGFIDVVPSHIADK